jgi:hypothetical protein
MPMKDAKIMTPNTGVPTSRRSCAATTRIERTFRSAAIDGHKVSLWVLAVSKRSDVRGAVV